MKVQSSNIESVVYHAAEREMYVRFHGGRVYRYRNISTYMVDALKKAKSIGAFFAKRIRPYPNEYPYEKVE